MLNKIESSKPIDPQLAVLHNHLHLNQVLDLERPLVLIDLDSTLASFSWNGVQNYRPDEVGDPIVGMPEMCRQLVDLGFVLELFTARFNIVSWWLPLEDRTIGTHEIRSAIRHWLNMNGFPKEITFSSPQNFHAQKRNALVVIDDNCVNPLFVSSEDIIEFCLARRTGFIEGLEKNNVIEEMSESTLYAYKKEIQEIQNKILRREITLDTNS